MLCYVVLCCIMLYYASEEKSNFHSFKKKKTPKNPNKEKAETPKRDWWNRQTYSTTPNYTPGTVGHTKIVAKLYPRYSLAISFILQTILRVWFGIWKSRKSWPNPYRGRVIFMYILAVTPSWWLLSEDNVLTAWNL